MHDNQNCNSAFSLCKMQQHRQGGGGKGSRRGGKGLPPAASRLQRHPVAPRQDTVTVAVVAIERQEMTMPVQAAVTQQAAADR